MVKTSEECKTAIQTLNLPKVTVDSVTNEDDEDYPKGCYLYKRTLGSGYATAFNTNGKVEGELDDLVQMEGPEPICRGGKMLSYH